MINISPECLQALKDDAVQHAEIKARLINGKTLTLTDADLILNGLEVENHAVCGEQLEVGSMTAAVLKLTLDNEDGRFNDIFFAGAEFTVKLLIPLGDGTSYTIPYGVYTVDEQPRTWSTIEIEAYDNMVKLDIPFDKTQVQTPATLRDIVHAGIDAAGLSCADYSMFPNGENNIDVLKIQSENPITWRQVLMWCCQCAGVCGFANGNGYIHFGFYKKYTPGILQTESAENLETEKADVLFIDGAAEGDFPLPPSLRFIDNMHLDESDCVLTGHQFKVGELLYPAAAVMDYGIVTENNLVFAAADASARDSFADTINQLLAGFTYRPYTCNILSMPQLQLLDSVDYNENGQHHHSIVTNYTFRLNGFMNIEAKAKSQVQKGWASLGALTPGQQAIIDSVSHKVDTTRDQLSSYENALLLFNEKMLHSMGLYKTVETDANGGMIVYFHDKSTLSESNAIYMFGASGFAWTTDGWNNGAPVWHYGFTDAGDALFDEVQAYKVSADLIQAGYLRSQNNASWINMENGEFCFGTDEKHPSLSLGTDKVLNIYGTLKSIAYPDLSVSIGESESSKRGAFLVTDKDYGDIFRVDTSVWSTGGLSGILLTAPCIDPKRSIGIEYIENNISLRSNQTTVECDKEYMDLRGNSAFIKLHNNQISVSSKERINNHFWFNYSKSPRGMVVYSYAFGNCSEGGYGEVYAAKFNTVSDPSQKENIQELSDLNALSKIMELRFYSYDYKNPLQDKSSEISANQFASDAPQTPHKIHEDIGIMATEAPTEIQSEDGEAIDLYAYISLTAKALQELSAKVIAQGQEIEALKAELSALKQ